MENKKRVLKGSAHASPEVRKAELLEAAIICFGRNGYFGTTIDHIAKESGLSKGSVYRFFKSKEDVLLGIARMMEQHFDDTYEHIYESSDNPRDVMRLVFQSAVVFLCENPEMERTWREFAFHPMAQKEYARMLDDYRNDLSDIYQKGVAEGIFIDQDMTAVFDTVLSYQEGLFQLSYVLPEFDAIQRFESSWPVLERAFVKPEHL
ncbi:TetR/AcrR family transcriptional regulator [Vibrio sp. HN007]|uniref:TetR/AcrR family transcriptional regulator n=1 Tax=Vibrio iocasae TaxID=3098914 RepID=UPI0035D3FAEB